MIDIKAAAREACDWDWLDQAESVVTDDAEPVALAYSESAYRRMVDGFPFDIGRNAVDDAMSEATRFTND